MGFSEFEVERLRDLDARREARWENGLAYMAERERLVAGFDGDALDAELGQLRQAYFGFEAETIAREEGQGFFRFERPRVYGRN